MKHFQDLLQESCPKGDHDKQTNALSQKQQSLKLKWVLLSNYFGQFWQFLANFSLIWPKFDPTLVHLTHFVTGVGSSNLIYALTVVIIF